MAVPRTGDSSFSQNAASSGPVRNRSFRGQGRNASGLEKRSQGRSNPGGSSAESFPAKLNDFWRQDFPRWSATGGKLQFQTCPDRFLRGIIVVRKATAGCSVPEGSDRLQ